MREETFAIWKHSPGEPMPLCSAEGLALLTLPWIKSPFCSLSFLLSALHCYSKGICTELSHCSSWLKSCVLSLPNFTATFLQMGSVPKPTKTWASLIWIMLRCWKKGPTPLQTPVTAQEKYSKVFKHCLFKFWEVCGGLFDCASLSVVKVGQHTSCSSLHLCHDLNHKKGLTKLCGRTLGIWALLSPSSSFLLSTSAMHCLPSSLCTYVCHRNSYTIHSQLELLCPWTFLLPVFLTRMVRTKVCVTLSLLFSNWKSLGCAYIFISPPYSLIVNTFKKKISIAILTQYNL